MPILDAKLRSALKSREARNIRRRLPDPPTSDSTLIDFNSNDYLSLSQSTALRDLFLSKLNAAPDVLGSGGSRLLVNGRAHSDLEARLARVGETVMIHVWKLTTPKISSFIRRQLCFLTLGLTRTSASFRAYHNQETSSCTTNTFTRLSTMASARPEHARPNALLGTIP